MANKLNLNQLTPPNPFLIILPKLNQPPPQITLKLNYIPLSTSISIGYPT